MVIKKKNQEDYINIIINNYNMNKTEIIKISLQKNIKYRKEKMQNWLKLENIIQYQGSLLYIAVKFFDQIFHRQLIKHQEIVNIQQQLIIKHK